MAGKKGETTVTIMVRVHDYWIEDTYDGSPTIYMLLEIGGKLKLVSHKESIV